MGEYATFNGESIKIGTCEQMYYLRADQVHMIQPETNSVNPRVQSQAEHIRFRFPFPNEDGIRPGTFEDFDRGLGLHGLEVPDGVDHYSLQFTRNYPSAGGLTLSTPCPESAEGKASGLKFNYNGYAGKVQIHSQRLMDGQLRLVCKCGSCGSLWRVDSLDQAQAILDALELYATQQCGTFSADFYRETARRVEAGYTQSNFWTPAAMAVSA